MLNVSGLCTDYVGERGQVIRAAQDVAFNVPPGKLFTLLGPSGCEIGRASCRERV